MVLKPLLIQVVQMVESDAFRAESVCDEANGRGFARAIFAGDNVQPRMEGNIHNRIAVFFNDQAVNENGRLMQCHIDVL